VDPSAVDQAGVDSMHHKVHRSELNQPAKNPIRI